MGFTGSAAPAMQKEAKAITVLCVDDEQQTALGSVLESEGYIAHADNGHHAGHFLLDARNSIEQLDPSGLQIFLAGSDRESEWVEDQRVG